MGCAWTRRGAALAMTLAWLVLGGGGGRAGDMSYYKNSPTTLRGEQECTDEDSGFHQVSCRYIEVGSIDGWLDVHQQAALKQVRLDKYWNNAGTYLKFAGVACGRGDSAQEARDLALGRGKMIVKRLIESFEEDNLSEELRKHASYREVDAGGSCVDTPNTREASVSQEAADDSDEDVDDLADDLAEEMEQLRQEAEREEERQREAQRARTATFVLRNDDRYKLGVKFFSIGTSRVWPGGGQQYVLGNEGTYRLACEPGEKICLGAWRNYQTHEWGVGRSGKAGCQGCCTTCGNRLETTLNGAGADSFPSSGGGAVSSGGRGDDGSSIVGDLVDILGGVAAGVDVYNSLGGGSGGGGGGGHSSPSPPPRGPNYRPSGISQ